MSGRRIRLDLSDFVLDVGSHRWMFLSDSKFSTVSDLAEQLKAEYMQLEEGDLVQVFMEGNFVIPPWESIEILQSGDLLRVVKTVSKDNVAKNKPVKANKVPPSLSEHSVANSKVSCVCMTTQPDSIMLDCHLCSFQQHASCYRILSVKEIPTEHCCVSCSKQHRVNCTDNTLVKMSNNLAVFSVLAVPGTCLFRRALFLLLEVELITVDIVVRRLGVDTLTAEAIVDKLRGVGCLEDHEVKGQWMVLREVLENKVIPKFIGRKGKKSNVGEGVVTMGGSEDGGVCGIAGDRKDKNSDIKNKGAKCSVVADVVQVSECE